jgi:hypothetical protein
MKATKLNSARETSRPEPSHIENALALKEALKRQLRHFNRRAPPVLGYAAVRWITWLFNGHLSVALGQRVSTACFGLREVLRHKKVKHCT